MQRDSSLKRLRWWPTGPELVHALRRRRGLAYGVGLVAGLAAAGAIWLTMPTGRHEAYALIHVKPDPSRTEPGPHFDEYKQTRERLLRTRSLFERVAADPTVSRSLEGQAVSDPARFLEDATRLRWESPELLTVTMTGDDPVLLQAAVDTLLAEYLRDTVSEDGISRLKQRRAIEVQLAELDRPTEGHRDTRAAEETRTALRQELVRLDLAEQSGPRVRKREGAVVDMNRNLTRKVVRSVAAFVVGLLLVVAVVALAEWRHRRVDSATQLTHRLGLTVLGTVPSVPNGDWRPGGQLDAVRASLLHQIGSKSAQTIAVSGVAVGERAALLTCQLAASLAGAGLRTVVVDCEPRDPSLHALFEHPRSPGCGELLLQELDVSDAARPTAVPNLWLIPAGEWSDRVSAAIVQETSVIALIDRLRRQYDFVVIHAGPAVAGSEATLIARHVDGFILSVQRNVSRLPQIRAAAETLLQLDLSVYGLVLCEVDQV